MISFEEAKKIAKETRPEFNKYEEYKELYVFDKADAGERLGGHDMPFIVLKSSGKVYGYSQYAIIHPERLMDKEKVSEGTF